MSPLLCTCGVTQVNTSNVTSAQSLSEERRVCPWQGVRGMLGHVCPGFGTAQRREACASSKLAKRSPSATPRLWTCLHLQPARGLLFCFVFPSEALCLPGALPCGWRLRDPAQQLAAGVGDHEHGSSCSRAVLARPSSSGRWARVLENGVDCCSLGVSHGKTQRASTISSAFQILPVGQGPPDVSQACGGLPPCE